MFLLTERVIKSYMIAANAPNIFDINS